jgi:hypothetical protein
MLLREREELALQGNQGEFWSFLTSSICRLSQERDFAKALGRAKIERVLEVGIGRGMQSDSVFVDRFLDLRRDNREFYFLERSVWACDPRILPEASPDVRESYVFSPSHRRLVRVRAEVAVVAEKVQAGEVEPFDAVISRGVISLGGLGILGAVHDSVDAALRIVEQKADCLDPKNPNALIIASARSEGSILLTPASELSQLGLEVIVCEEADASPGSIGNTFKRLSAFRSSRLFNKVALRRR